MSGGSLRDLFRMLILAAQNALNYERNSIEEMGFESYLYIARSVSRCSSVVGGIQHHHMMANRNNSTNGT
jgi:hypothetical protein